MVRDGGTFYGCAGADKTLTLCEMARKANNPLILSFTNKAIENVKTRLKKMAEEDITFNKPELQCYTFDIYFCEYHGRDIPDLEGKTIFIEEYSMVPNKWMTKVYQAFTKYQNTIYLYGDSNQCDPVENGSQIHYNYMTSVTMREMCPNRQELQYKEDSSL